jgi:diacylglycerol O-acyltransferase / wax synthase
MSELLSPLDACWLHMESASNPMMITAVLTFGAPLPYDGLLALLGERLIARYPRFSQRVAEPPLGVGPPRWEADADFQLRRHVHRVGLPAPGDRGTLQELVGDLMSTQLDLRRAPWDLHLVEGYDGGCAVVARIHHCVADGISLARMLLSLADGGAATEAEEARPSAREQLQRARDLATHALSASVHALSHPLELARTLTAQTGTAMRLVTLPPDPHTPLRGALGVQKRCAWSEPIPLDSVKAIGRARGATVNDVLLAALAGAVRSWLLERDAEVDQVRIFVPINLRPLDEPIPRELGNLFSLVVAELPVGMADPRDRLAAVHRRMEELKHSRDPEVVYAILSVMGATPPAVERLFVDFLGQKASAVVTNVAGPREPLAWAGAPVSGVLVWVPQSGNVALGVSILSYAGQVVVGVATDAQIIENPGAIVRGVLTELETLASLR